VADYVEPEKRPAEVVCHVYRLPLIRDINDSFEYSNDGVGADAEVDSKCWLSIAAGS